MATFLVLFGVAAFFGLPWTYAVTRVTKASWARSYRFYGWCALVACPLIMGACQVTGQPLSLV